MTIRSAKENNFFWKRTAGKIVGFLLLGLTAALFTGCQNQGPSRADIINLGRDTFAEKCYACHRVNGQGGNRGPDLTHVGSRYDEAWFKRWLENPYDVKPGSTMPRVELSADDINNLSVYLTSLK